VKKKRTIVLKDPHLRDVRKNLRHILLKWGSKQWNQLFDECDRLDRNKDGKLKRPSEFSDAEKDLIANLEKKMVEIEKIINHSICKCTLCNASDKDMTYNPVQERWFCVDCYRQLQKDYKGKKEAALFP
jgi:hypothetical protein